MEYAFLTIVILFFLFCLWCITWKPTMTAQEELDTQTREQMSDSGWSEEEINNWFKEHN